MRPPAPSAFADNDRHSKPATATSSASSSSPRPPAAAIPHEPGAAPPDATQLGGTSLRPLLQPIATAAPGARAASDALARSASTPPRASISAPSADGPDETASSHVADEHVPQAQPITAPPPQAVDDASSAPARRVPPPVPPRPAPALLRPPPAALPVPRPDVPQWGAHLPVFPLPAVCSRQHAYLLNLLDGHMRLAPSRPDLRLGPIGWQDPRAGAFAVAFFGVPAASVLHDAYSAVQVLWRQLESLGFEGARPTHARGVRQTSRMCGWTVVAWETVEDAETACTLFTPPVSPVLTCDTLEPFALPVPSPTWRACDILVSRPPLQAASPRSAVLAPPQPAHAYPTPAPYPVQQYAHVANAYPYTSNHLPHPLPISPWHGFPPQQHPPPPTSFGFTPHIGNFYPSSTIFQPAHLQPGPILYSQAAAGWPSHVAAPFPTAVAPPPAGFTAPDYGPRVLPDYAALAAEVLAGRVGGANAAAAGRAAPRASGSTRIEGRASATSAGRSSAEHGARSGAGTSAAAAADGGARAGSAASFAAGEGAATRHPPSE
ncbi:hypothetical protein JCM3775_002731 [Rhodotorula graminis]